MKQFLVAVILHCALPLVVKRVANILMKSKMYYPSESLM